MPRGYGEGYVGPGLNFDDAKHHTRGGGSSSHPRGYKHGERESLRLPLLESLTLRRRQNRLPSLS